MIPPNRLFERCPWSLMTFWGGEDLGIVDLSAQQCLPGSCLATSWFRWNSFDSSFREVLWSCEISDGLRRIKTLSLRSRKSLEAIKKLSLYLVCPPKTERMTSWKGWRSLPNPRKKSAWRHGQAGNFCNFEESVSSITPGFRVRILKPLEKENPTISTHHTTNTAITHHVQPWPYIHSM